MSMIKETTKSAETPAMSPAAERYLMEVSNIVASTLDLDELLQKVSEIIGRLIPYNIFAILLLNERKQRMHVRFQIGHPPEHAERIRIRIGEGITGQAALKRQSILVNDVRERSEFVPSGADVGSELAAPLISRNRVIGVIDVASSEANHFTREHQMILTLVASRIAVAVENARLYSRVSRQARTLQLLNDISRDLTSILDLDQLFRRVGESLHQLIEYQMFSILLLDKDSRRLQHRFSLRNNESISIKRDIALGEGLAGYAAEYGVTVLSADVRQDPRYIAINLETRSELVAPLIYKGKTIGVLDLEHEQVRKFNDEHARAVSTLAAQVAVAIENARLYEDLAAHERRLEHDLSLAHELQYRLLPANSPTLKRSELAAKFVPARAIGGDLYDFLPYNSRTTSIIIGDVSGKGAPAAIYAALVSGILRSHAAHKLPPAEMLSAVNLALTERPIEAQYVSIIYALWDTKNSLLRISNSGLPLPFHCRDGRASEIDARGLPLGLFATADYDEIEVAAEPGDLFVFFSDGILDARDERGHMFGSDRLRAVIEKNCRLTAYEIVNAIFEAVSEFVGRVEAFDDQTVVALRIKDKSAK